MFQSVGNNFERTNFKLTNIKKGWKSLVWWLANWTHDLKVVGLNLVLSKILDGNGLKAMPGLIPAPYSGSFMEK
jgi:hypothetical protein